MAFKGKLLTRDKLKSWGCIQDENCVLCGEAVETSHHLFFTCNYSKDVWKEVLRRNGLYRSVGNWGEEMSYALIEAKGDSFTAHVRALALAVTVYCIWMERNCRIFRQTGLEWAALIVKVENKMRDATWFWKARRNSAHWMVCKEWGFNDSRMLA